MPSLGADAMSYFTHREPDLCQDRSEAATGLSKVFTNTLLYSVEMKVRKCLWKSFRK